MHLEQQVFSGCTYPNHSDTGKAKTPWFRQISRMQLSCRSLTAPFLQGLSPASSQAVLVHQLSKQASQAPFRKNRGRVVAVAFHPGKPFLFVATQNSVRVYNLAAQSLAKKLLAGSGIVTSMALHPSGDHLLLGAQVFLLLHHHIILIDVILKSLIISLVSVLLFGAGCLSWLLCQDGSL